MAQINSLKFESKKERDDWCETLTNRFKNLCRNVKLAENRDPQAKWVRELLPWIENDDDDDIDALVEDLMGSEDPDQDDGDGEDGEEEKDNDDEIQMPEPKIRPKYEVKFSTELMLPLRRKKDDLKAAWEPGLIKDDPDCSNLVGTWPDGFETIMKETTKFVAGAWSPK